jgi:hypothetical protein
MDAREIQGILHAGEDSFDSMDNYLAHHYNIAENVVMGDALAYAMAGSRTKVFA